MIKIAFILLILCHSNSVIADIYKYTDNHGRIYYTKELSSHLYGSMNKSRGIKASTLKITLSKYFSKLNRLIGTNKHRFHDLIQQTAFRHHVDARLVHAVIQTESAYNSTAQSPKGAVGLMQLMPDTASRFGVKDRNDPDQNVEGGTRYLKHLIKLFAPRLELALAAYNAGENAVISHHNSIPPYPETQNYVKQVLSLYRPASSRY
jgi:soluble lytic murein transglycosylase-like protein